jgi:acetyl esterase/lipase
LSIALPLAILSPPTNRVAPAPLVQTHATHRQHGIPSMITETLNHTTEDIEYLRHSDRSMTLRLFRPLGAGPFPAVLDVHGGAWSTGDATECYSRDESLADAGIAAAALEFRQGADGYPSSLIDINYAVRWLKAHAGDLRIDPDRICLIGTSSGGHLAMLSAMRPRDPRYASIALDAGGPAVDATVRCVAMLWPVINPISRYKHVLRARNSANPPDWVGDIVERQDLFWRTEGAMTEGNPMLALETGEKVVTPPALLIQGRPDPVHDYRDSESPLDLNEPERFAANYRKAGGSIEVSDVEQDKREDAAMDPLVRFLKQQLPPAR